MTPPDLRAIESLDIFDEARLAGTLSRTAHGAQFSYDSAYRSGALASGTMGIAFHLPITRETSSVSGANLHPFFAGLLPEGLRLKALRQTLKTSEDDLFSMLAALGSNCIGNVYARASESTEAPSPIIHASSNVSFLELFESSIYSADPMQRERDPGVPGAMPKISASMISFPVNVAKKRRQFLLKLGSDAHPRLVENEHFFMQMARDCGIRVAPAQLVYDKHKNAGLLVERFDRLYDSSTRSFRRLHQEDACQFLDRYPQDKYRLSMREICDGVATWGTAPLIDIRSIIELYVFSYLIGNGDLHAKNISLVRTPSGDRIELSPAYDLLSTIPYGDRKMALRLNGRDDEFRRPDLVTFGAIFGIPEKAVAASITRIINRTKLWAPRFREIGLDDRVTRDLIKTYETRAGKLQST